MRFLFPAAGALLLLILGGCESLRATPTSVNDPSSAGGSAVPSQPAQPVVANTNAPSAPLAQTYALLYGVVERNKEVDKILILKSVSPTTKGLVKRIAAACAEAADHLKGYAKSPTGLPPAEEKARVGVEKVTRGRLFSHSGDDFEVALLLTQHSALEYCAVLARDVEAAEKAPASKAWAKATAAKFEDLDKQVVDRLGIRKDAASK
jgi:hypothetical protein